MSQKSPAASKTSKSPSLSSSRRPSLKDQFKSVVEQQKSEIEWVNLTEDFFGFYQDKWGKQHEVKKFTWRNKNKIEVAVINYGARIVSMKFPDKNGAVEDIVLGFDDLAGYIYYQKYYFGATIGRMSNTVENCTFQIDKTTFKLSKNFKNNHVNGGKEGFDQQVWTAHVEDKRVIMSHVSPHMSEGYPGDLLVRITFVLTEKNEFKIDMEAFTTRSTIINLSNLTYFNLGGHFGGPEETYKHIVTANCNCFTPKQDQTSFPSTGKVLNVVHTINDFQVPTLLGKVIDAVGKEGINQNLCVNMGMDQDDCFVARAFHPPSGRLLEIYSNQRGVNFSTGNDFGCGIMKSPIVQDMTNEQDAKEEFTPYEADVSKTNSVDLALMSTIYEKLPQNLKANTNNFRQVMDIVMKLKSSSTTATPANTPDGNKSHSQLKGIVLTQEQMDYLETIIDILRQEKETNQNVWLRENLKHLLNFVIIQDSISLTRTSADQSRRMSEANAEERMKRNISKSLTLSMDTPIKRNRIPPYYKWSNLIVGKDRFIYKFHGGIAFQTQNYPGCEKYKNFPNCVLKPGENYKHSITYKFWVRAGNPNKWIKRNEDAIAQAKQSVTVNT